jgi:hypothetical protein
VFDFKEEDELPELTSGKFLGKLKNSNLDNHAMLKYEFLECGNVPSISVFFFFFPFNSQEPNGAFDFDF